MLTKRKGSLILNEFMWIRTQVHSTEQVASCNSLSQMLNLFLYKKKKKEKKNNLKELFSLEFQPMRS